MFVRSRHRHEPHPPPASPTFAPCCCLSSPSFHLHRNTPPPQNQSHTHRHTPRSQMRYAESNRQGAKIGSRKLVRNVKKNKLPASFPYGTKNNPAVTANSSICPRWRMRSRTVADDDDGTMFGPLHQTQGPPRRSHVHAEAAARCHEQHRHDDVLGSHLSQPSTSGHDATMLLLGSRLSRYGDADGDARAAPHRHLA